MDKETVGRPDRWIYRDSEKWTDGQGSRQNVGKTYIQMYRQIEWLMDRQKH